MNVLPLGSCITLERQRHQQGAPVQILVAMCKVHAAVPHHGAEIRLQIRVAVIISSRLILCVILLHRTVTTVKKRRYLNARSIIDQRQLLRYRIRHIVRHLCAAIEQ